MGNNEADSNTTSRTQPSNIVSDRHGDNNNTSSENYIWTIIRPFDGILTETPITFEPQQLLIPAESYGFVTITFNPKHSQDVNQMQFDENGGINFDNYLLGFLSIKKCDLFVGNQISRCHQYLVNQIKLDITGRILRPR